MNKKQASGAQNIGNYLLVVLISAAMGTGITWMFTSRNSSPRPGGEFSTRAPLASPPEAAIPNATPDVSGMSAGDAALTLGNFAYDHQRWPEAILRYQEAISSGIDTADVHTDLGNAFRFSGRTEEALNQYQIAQKINPQHENSLFNEISLFREVLNEPVRAAEVAEEFMRRFPNSDKLPAVREQLARTKQRAQ
jgi:tetratricopeptide (TPR) repeat protein